MQRGTWVAGVLISVVAGFSMVTPAYAGNIWLTGHDADFHCTLGAQCNHFGTAINFARLDAPDPTKPLLFLDTMGFSELEAAAAMPASTAKNTIEGPGMPFTHVLMSPTDPGFATLLLSTSTYSAIVIASDTTCGGCDLNTFSTTPHSDAINARTADITSFFNAGGGLVYFAGASHSAVYYASVPVAATPVAVSPPFTLTADGTTIGLIGGSGFGSDTNCCATHNSFLLPGAGSPLKVAELDEAGFAETLYAGNVSIGGGGFTGGDGGGPVVPEPASLLLFGLGGIGAGIMRRRQRVSA